MLSAFSIVSCNDIKKFAKLRSQELTEKPSKAYIKKQLVINCDTGPYIIILHYFMCSKCRQTTCTHLFLLPTAKYLNYPKCMIALWCARHAPRHNSLFLSGGNFILWSDGISFLPQCKQSC